MYTNSILGSGTSGNSQDDMVHGEVVAVIQNGGGGTIAAMITNTTNVSCLGGNDGSATAQGSTGSGNYGYAWSNGAMTATANNLAAGTYTVTVTDMNNGATATAMTPINQPNSAVTVNIMAQQNIDCNNMTGSATANGSGGTGNITYDWSNGMSGATVTLAPGLYTVTATDANGCTSTVQGTMMQDLNPPTTEAGPDMQIDCNTTLVTLQGSGDFGGQFSYNWTTTNGNIVSGANTQNPIVNAAGTYAFVITNNNSGCTNSDNTTVTEDTTTPIANAGADMTLTCVQMEVILSGSASSQGANFSYQWTTVDGNIVAGANTLMPTVDATGTYCLTVTNNENGCSTVDCVTVNEDFETPIISIAVPAPIDCLNNCVILDASGSSTGTEFLYQWTGPGTINGENTPMPQVCNVGSYELVITNLNNGCTASAIVEIVEDTMLPTFTAVVSGTLNCNNSEVTINTTTDTNNVTFTWTGPNGYSSTDANPVVSEPGIYDGCITNNGNGCEICIQVTVTTIDPPTATISNQSNVDCNGQNTGSATVSAADGTGNYTYLWSNGGMSATETSLAAGMYTVTVTDEDQCTATASVTITEPTAIILSVTTFNETSNGANDGSAFADVSNGVGDFTFLWSNGEVLQTINNLSAGEYCVTVTDSNGCSAEACGIVAMFGCANVSTVISSTPVSCFGELEGIATATSSGGTAPYVYIWSNGENTATIEDLAAGIYTVTCTDADDCSAIISVTIEQPNELTIDIIETGDVDCAGNENGFASSEASGGISDYGYLWNNDETTSMITQLAPGTYSVTATDQNMCTAETSISINLLPDTEPPVILTNNLNMPLDANGMASITTEMVDGGSTDNCAIQSITLDILDFNCDNLGANQVILTVTDEAGLIATQSATVNIIDVIDPVLTCPDNVVVQGCNLIVEYDMPTATDNCTTFDPILMNGLPSGDVFPSGETTVEWSVNDVAGNSNNCSFTVTLDADFSTTTTFIEPTCTNFSDGTATAEPTGGVAPFAYNWSDPEMQNTQTAINLLAGNYTVTITDATGCTTIAEVEVTEPDLLEITISEVVNETNNDMNGEITIGVNGGSGNYNYEWVLDGNLFSTEANLTNLAAGIYTIEVTDDANCTQIIMVEVETIVGTFENTESEQIDLFPNPTTGEFQLDIQLSTEKEVSVAIFDLMGKAVFTQVAKPVLKENLRVDLEGFSDGIYLVKVQVGEDVLVKKVILRKQ